MISNTTKVKGNSEALSLSVAFVLCFLATLFFAVPYHLLISNPFVTIHGKFNAISEIKNIYLQYFKSSAVMNWLEIFIWVILPTFFIIIVLVQTKPKRDWRKILIGLILGLTIYGMAFFHNQFSINQRYISSLETDIPRTEQLFHDLEYPTVKNYKLLDYSHTFGSTKGRSISFETNDAIETVASFYLGRGFTTLDAKYPPDKKGLWKHSGYNYGSDKYASLEIIRSDGITKVTISKVDYNYT